MPYTVDEKTRTWVMLCHLSALTIVLGIPFGIFIASPLLVPFALIGPLVVWLVKGDENTLINEQGKESVNFQISMLIYFICLSPLLLICTGAILWLILGILDVALVIVASVRTSRGESYAYPFNLRLIK